MKTKDLAKQYGLNLPAFEQWLENSGHPHRSGFTGTTVDDALAETLANEFIRYVGLEQDRLAQADRAAQEKQQALASMLITSGFSFDGWTITKYSGYISGDDAVSVERPREEGWGNRIKRDVGDDLMGSLSEIRRNALAELKEAAYALGCNAVIGVDFDYLTLDPETMRTDGSTVLLPFLFAVTANGNAVVIEKDGAGGEA